MEHRPRLLAPASVPLVIGVTSHRNIPAREVDLVRRRVREFLAQLQRDFPALPLVVLSALAEGGDQLVAEEALALGARLIAPLPLPRELYVEDFHHAATRDRFDALAARARVIELPLLPDSNPRGIDNPGPQRDRQYGRAGVFIARHCHLLLAIWDGKASTRLGGTAQEAEFFLSGVMPGLTERRRGAVITCWAAATSGCARPTPGWTRRARRCCSRPSSTPARSPQARPSCSAWS